ncbi:MAG: efflux RND transporter periplasmic adaptor subunit [Chroococcales cyanobacterium]
MTHQPSDTETPDVNDPMKAEDNSPTARVKKRKKTFSDWISGQKGFVLGIGIGIIVAVGGTQLFASPSSNVPTDSSETPIEAETPPKTVTVAIAQNIPVAQTLEATGSVAAVEMIPISSQATGLTIQQVLVDQGDYVKSGQVLVRLDDSQIQAQLAQAKAGVAEAEARLAELRSGTRSEELAQARERVRSAEMAVSEAESELNLIRKRVERNQFLSSEGAIARDRLDEILTQEEGAQLRLEQAQARYQEARQQYAQLEAGPRPEVITQAQARLAQAKAQQAAVVAQLKDTQVIAPVSGKVATRNARVGDVTSPSVKLFEVIQNGQLELLLKVPETQLPQINVGQTVQITSNSDRNLNITGKVKEIDPVVNEQSRQATLKVALPNEDSLRPGMFLRGAIVTDTAPTMTVPAKAVLPQEGTTAIVYRVNGETVEAVTVEMGQLLPDDQVEILSGLSVNDSVVVKGAPYLKDGDRISIAQE